MQVSTNKVVADFVLFDEFCKAVNRAISDRKFVHLAYDGEYFSLHSEGAICSVFVKVQVESDAKPFSAGVDATKFLAAFKKLYKGKLTFKFSKSKVELKKDNITIKFPVISTRSYIEKDEGISITGESKDWLVSNLIACIQNLEEVSKKAVSEKFLGILFETDVKTSRIVKFAQSALYLSSTEAIFQQPYRVLFPDILAGICRIFPKEVKEIIFSKTRIGLTLEHGVKIMGSMPIDTYPQEYIKVLGLQDEKGLIPQGSMGYVFARDDLMNAVDIVSTTLGDSESWVSMSTIGKSEGSLVWEVKGKSYDGVEVTENILSTDGEVIQPFAVNKKRMLRCLSSFEDSVIAYDLSNSSLALANDSGDSVVLLIKAVI